MLEAIGGADCEPSQSPPVKRETVWVSRTLSHCSSSSGDRIAWPARAVRSTITC